MRNGLTVVTDPHDGKSIGIRPPRLKADVVLISHDHYDHNAVRVIKGDHAELSFKEGSFCVNGLQVDGHKTYHDDSEGTKRGTNIVYRFQLDDTVFCHLGDLGHTLSDEIMEKIGEIDVLFIPIGGVTTINSNEAKDIIDRIRPRIVVPMHYRISGLGLVLDNVETFLAGIPEELIYRVGNEIDFTRDDMIEAMEYWIFSM